MLICVLFIDIPDAVNTSLESLITQDLAREDTVYATGTDHTTITGPVTSLYDQCENSSNSEPFHSLGDGFETSQAATCLEESSGADEAAVSIIPVPYRDAAMTNAQNYQSHVTDYSHFQTLVDLPTTLIGYWFSHVCPMWSTFDSEVNYNRLVALGTWTTSKPVFYALQVMSAACLVDSMPQLNSILPALKSHATAAIKQAMSVLLASPVNVTIDLVFAVFAMGTSYIGLILLNSAARCSTTLGSCLVYGN